MEIIATGLCKRYTTKWIIKDFDCQILSGQSIGITGINGSGKSTLIAMLMNSIPQTKGKIHYNQKNQVIEKSELLKHISFAAPYMQVFEYMSLKELLEFHIQFKPLVNGMHINDFIQYSYLESSKDEFISNFSSGMKQRLKIALAILSDTSCIFLDEPGSYLDSQAHQWYINALREFKNNRTCIIASNDERDFYNMDARLSL